MMELAAGNHDASELDVHFDGLTAGVLRGRVTTVLGADVNVADPGDGS
jgi:hypothetical protein